MKYSLALVASLATSISALAFPMPQTGSSGSCDTSALEECATPLLSTVEDCGTDLTCLCSAVQTLVSCYDQHCPGEEPTEVTQAVSACGDSVSDIVSATSEFGSASSRFASATRSAFGDDDEPTSTGLGPGDLASETSSAFNDDDDIETTTRRVIDPESTATETERVTATRSADDDEETSSAEDDDETTSAGEAGGVATTTRRPTATATGSAPVTQSTGAAEGLAVPALGGLLAMALGAVALL